MGHELLGSFFLATSPSPGSNPSPRRRFPYLRGGDPPSVAPLEHERATECAQSLLLALKLSSAARMMSTNSGLRDAPPTRAPSLRCGGGGGVSGVCEREGRREGGREGGRTCRAGCLRVGAGEVSLGRSGRRKRRRGREKGDAQSSWAFLPATEPP